MILLITNMVAIVVMGFLVLRHGRDYRARNSKPAFWLKVTGLIPLGLQVAIFLFFGIGEMASGDPSGVGHLFPVIVIALLGALAWMRPLEGGVALFVCGVLASVGFLGSLLASGRLPESTVISPVFMINSLPQIVSGVLFFLAGWMARRTAIATADEGNPQRIT